MADAQIIIEAIDRASGELSTIKRALEATGDAGARAQQQRAGTRGATRTRD